MLVCPCSTTTIIIPNIITSCTTNKQPGRKKPCPYVKTEKGCWHGGTCKFDNSLKGERSATPSTSSIAAATA
eukprot:8934552-Prorocentrum_lima.AAC.1